VAKPVRGSKIALLGVSYKGGVGDIRESPALRIIEMLGQLGAVLSYHDSYVPELPGHGLRSTSLEDLLDSGPDAVVLVTAHPDVDYGAVVERSPLLVDLRGRTRGSNEKTIVRL